MAPKEYDIKGLTTEEMEQLARHIADAQLDEHGIVDTGPDESRGPAHVYQRVLEGREDFACVTIYPQVNASHAYNIEADSPLGLLLERLQQAYPG